LKEQSIAQNKFKVCLEYHLKNCMAPCEALQSVQDYNASIELARSILKGNIMLVRNTLQDQINQYAKLMQYEKAQTIKYKLDKLERYQAKSVVSNPDLGEIDVFTLLQDEEKAFVNFTKVNNGMVIHSDNYRIDKKLKEDAIQIAEYVVPEIRAKYRSTTTIIITNLENSFSVPDAEVHVPKIGDKRKLVELSLKNLLLFKNEYLLAKVVKVDRNKETLEHLKNALSLQDLPVHIECFDNSNLQGSSPVASMVCFLNGKPSKKDYRHFSIKTVEGPDDFSSMKEIVGRRYTRVLEESLPLPQLIVVDGGKGQLNAAIEALKKLDIYQKVTVIGIAKRLEDIYFPGDSEPLHLHKKSPALVLLQHIRNEAHRFAITFHRLKRSKKAVEMQLESIKGVGPKTLQLLYKEFKTYKGIEDASIERLSEVVGEAKARIIKNQ
jgi:excinuclease ABC subunit C